MGWKEGGGRLYGVGGGRWRGWKEGGGGLYGEGEVKGCVGCGGVGGRVWRDKVLVCTSSLHFSLNSEKQRAADLWRSTLSEYAMVHRLLIRSSVMVGLPEPTERYPHTHTHIHTIKHVLSFHV